MGAFRKATSGWVNVTPALGPTLTGARLQLHHAAQFVACFGISYLPHADDDSHTNMEWFAGTLASQPAGPNPIRLAVRPFPLSLVILGADAELLSLELGGKTIEDGARWVRAQVTKLGLDGDRYSLAKHYTIPDHPVARGTPFDTTDAAKFDELARWYGNAALSLGSIAGAMSNASAVRCWPHHFDIATLITLAPGKTVGAGMEPGDVYYDEPYWYVNMTPSPPDDAWRPPLAGSGIWHTHEWLGAVLPSSRMADGPSQHPETTAFLGWAIGACTSLLSS